MYAERARADCQSPRSAVGWSRGLAARAGVQNLIDARRKAIHRVASQHHVRGLRWWPTTANPVWLDFVIEGRPASLPAFRSDLEAALGCRVALYLADQIPEQAWGRMLVETVAL
jgi:hypothetical protein